jgi:hypothetical protein
MRLTLYGAYHFASRVFPLLTKPVSLGLHLWHEPDQRLAGYVLAILDQDEREHHPPECFATSARLDWIEG